jgi:hypothetical protein
MNPELTGNAELNSEQSEWDSLSDKVEFNEAGVDEPNSKLEMTEEEAKRSCLRYLFVANWGKNLDAMVKNCCFEGESENDRSNLDAYVISDAIGEFLSGEDQEKMISAYANSEPVSGDLRRKIEDGIIDMVVDTGMFEEVVKDPYLRRRHADSLTQRYEPNREISMLQDILWGTDANFKQSEEFKGLITDYDYIKQKYNVQRIVDTSRDYNPGMTDEMLEAQYVTGISECLQYIVNNNEATVEELFNDPFFRKQRFGLLYDIETKGVEIKTEIAELWRMDVDFTESYDYGRMLFKYAEKNPDIYQNNDKAEVDAMVSEAIGKISEKQIAEVIKKYEKDPRAGDQMIVDLLVPFLGLSENRPTLKYGPAKGREGGFYKRGDHSITICEENLDKDSQGEERILDETSSFFGFLKTKKLEDKMFYRMGAVAHEMWHARQWGGNGIPEEKKEQYRRNFVYYMKGNSFYGAYRDQLIEREAWAFGEKMEERCRNKYYKKGKNK